MSKGKYEKQSPKRFPWVATIVAIVLIALLLLLLLKCCNGAPLPNYENEADITTTAEKDNDSIAIPGYEGLTLQADSKKQELCLPNPPQNTCYFQISLFLEDGTLLWQSDLIEPGETSEPMVLEKALEKGTYPNAILRYSCFTLDKDRSPLNGAEIKVTLRVQ